MMQTANIGERFETLALTQADAPAIVIPGQRTLTFADLYAQIRSTRAYLCEWGCNPTDVVAAVITDRHTMALSCVTVPAHATFAPLSPALSYAAYLQLLQRLRPRVVLLECGPAHAARQAVVALGLSHVDLRLREGNLDGELKQGTSASQHAEHDKRNPSWAYLLSSSGSTGESKLIPVTHESIRRNAEVLADRLEFRSSDVGCHITPMHFTLGLRGGLIVPLLCGTSIAIVPENDVERFFAALSDIAVTWVTAGFTLVRHLAERSAEFTKQMAHSRLRFIRCGSGVLPPEVIRFVEERLRAPMIAAYSITEAGFVSMDPLPPKVRKPGSVGFPTHDEVLVVDQAGEPCASGELGEIVVRGPMVFQGYFDDPGRTERCFRNGWFCTGDLGNFDEDGHLFIRGRLDDVINRGGEKILPVEVDQVLEQIPGIKEAAAFAFPHATLGEELVVAVVGTDDAELSAGAIRAHLFSGLGRRGVPRHVYFVDRLPRTGSGKIKRFELTRQFLQSEWRTESTRNAPAVPLAAALQSMWSALLHVDHVGVDDDFFMLGGDSLTGARLLAQVKEVFGVALALDRLFSECATVNAMGWAIETARGFDPGRAQG